jgi:hypothetical protein
MKFRGKFPMGPCRIDSESFSKLLAALAQLLDARLTAAKGVGLGPEVARFDEAIVEMCKAIAQQHFACKKRRR